MKNYFKYMFMYDPKLGLSLLLHDMVWIPNRDYFSMDIKNVIFVNHHVRVYIMQVVLMSQVLSLIIPDAECPSPVLDPCSTQSPATVIRFLK